MMFAFLSILSFSFQWTLSNSALPPGYEDRLFCPPSYCLGRKHPGAGTVGPKSMFWECRWGTGSEEDSEIKEPTAVVPWGPKLDQADSKLKQYTLQMYHEEHCKVFHGKSKDGTYQVMVDDYDDYESSNLLGDGGPSMMITMLGASGILCFVMFCCISSALGASSNYSPEESSGGGAGFDDLEATVDIDKIR